MGVPSTVHELVERFRENQEHYTAATYKEFRLRKEFVDPFLECLGWDLANKSGYAEAYKDVVHEDSIKIAGASKAPDYAFRIGGTRKFFVETKSPSINLKDHIDSAYQLRRYGWSAKLPLSILTNFVEFAVYDCRIRPDKSDKASTARVLYFTFDQYAQRWEEIAGIFSKVAITKGSFDKFADDATKKRGTAEVDVAFLAEIEDWREALAKNIALRNSGISVRDLNTSVQRTIDRIIFLRIAEDRGIEPYGRLKSITRGPNIYSRLAEILRQADSRYNSGLFHFDPEEGSFESVDTLTLGLSIDDKILKDILVSLYYPESPYEFGVLPADILGQVYEQFLGKVIRLSGKSAIVEEKPEVKKAGGVFYTPTFVASYIVRRVLGSILEGKTPAQAGGTGKRTKSFPPVTVLDPACGSGSFLIEAYQYFLDWYWEQYMTEGPEKYAKIKEPRLYRAANGQWRLTINEKRRILLSHIYGVDVDEQAVEVTKLSLLLKVLEDENADLLAAQMKLFHTRALPDLGRNIKCGNSLVTHDFYEIQASLFSDSVRLKINAFDWSEEFDFLFDAVIGNPPYGADYTDDEKVYFQKKYSYRRGKPETYLFFLEQGLRLLRPGGLLGFIIPNAWLSNFYGLQMRSLLLENGSVIEVADLEPVKVFKSATVDTCITILENASPASRKPILISRAYPDRAIRREFEVKQGTWMSDHAKIFNVYATDPDLKIMAKMEASRQTLKSIVDYSQGVIPYKTKADGEKNLYISSQPKKGWRPLIESAAQVEQYRLAHPQAFIDYGRWLWCARDPKYFEPPKILFHRLRKKLPQQLVGAIDTSRAVNRHALSNLILREGHQEDELWAILALFNSDLVNWWFVKRYGPLMEVGGFKVESIPLPPGWEGVWPTLAAKAKDITGALATTLSIKNEQIRSVREREAKSDRRSIEKILARSYGLTEEEAMHTINSLHNPSDRFNPVGFSGADEGETVG